MVRPTTDPPNHHIDDLVPNTARSSTVVCWAELLLLSSLRMMTRLIVVVVVVVVYDATQNSFSSIKGVACFATQFLGYYYYYSSLARLFFCTNDLCTIERAFAMHLIFGSSGGERCFLAFCCCCCCCCWEEGEVVHDCVPNESFALLKCCDS